MHTIYIFKQCWYSWSALLCAYMQSSTFFYYLQYCQGKCFKGVHYIISGNLPMAINLRVGGRCILKIVIFFLKNTLTSHRVSLALLMCVCSGSAMPLLHVLACVITANGVCLHLLVPPLTQYCCCFFVSCYNHVYCRSFQFAKCKVQSAKSTM